MSRILYLDACMRGENSRTARLCRTFLDCYTALRPTDTVIHRDLTAAALPVLTASLSERRDELAALGREHPLLEPAREVAGADLILIGAPYWDLSFPAALKIYLEWACTLGITFRYTEAGAQQGMSRAEDLVFLTTAGGPIGESNFGYQYLKGWAAMLGVKNTCCVSAECLDIRGADVPGILDRAAEQTAALARRLAREAM